MTSDFLFGPQPIICYLIIQFLCIFKFHPLTIRHIIKQQLINDQLNIKQNYKGKSYKQQMHQILHFEQPKYKILSRKVVIKGINMTIKLNKSLQPVLDKKKLSHKLCFNSLKRKDSKLRTITNQIILMVQKRLKTQQISLQNSLPSISSSKKKIIPRKSTELQNQNSKTLIRSIRRQNLIRNLTISDNPSNLLFKHSLELLTKPLQIEDQLNSNSIQLKRKPILKDIKLNKISQMGPWRAISPDIQNVK